MAKKLYVGNIPFKATEDEIRSLFAGVGEVVSVNLITDGRTGQPKGFGFVEMATEGAAQEAIESLNGTVVHDRTINVSEARPPKQNSDRGGFGGGSGGGSRGGYGRESRSSGGGSRR